MRTSVDESWNFMRQDPRIKQLMLEGIAGAKPYRKAGNRMPTTARNTEQEQMFKKVWYSAAGDRIRLILQENLGASRGVRDAARLYFREVWTEVQHERKGH